MSQQDQLTSDVGVDYTLLHDLLIDGRWLQADETTASDEEHLRPQGASYYNGEFLQPRRRLTLLATARIAGLTSDVYRSMPGVAVLLRDRDYTSRVHWDCECGWMDDTV